MKKAGSVKAAALDLARRGWAVFPIKQRDKTPATEHGFKDGSTDPAVVERLFAGRSDYNIGIATGPASGVWVLDVEAEGIEDLDRLQRQHGKLPETVVSITGGGGRHHYFTYNGAEVRNRTKIEGLAIDVRGDGGYVVVPPSIHASGKRYEWEYAPDSTPIVEAPSWLVELVVGNDITGDNGKPAAALSFTVGGGTIEDLSTAAGAPKGKRHATALVLIGSAIGRGGDLCGVATAAVEWARRCSPPMEEGEVLKIVSDLSQKQGTKPAARSAGKKPPAPPAPWKPFPVEALPEPVRTYVQRSAAAIGVDPAYVATAILPALAAAIGNSRQIILKRGWVEPAVLWGVLVGDSGTLKSPSIDMAVKYVRKRQAASVEFYRRAIEQYERDVAKSKHGGQKKGGPPPEEFVRPICERFACSDVTVEGLAVLLADTWRGLLLIRDELAGWVGSFDQYKSGHGSDTAHWLTIHGARDLLVDRKSGDKKTIYVRRAAVSIVGGIQPATLRRVLGSEHFENGLAARLLLAMPPRRAKKWTEAEVDRHLDDQITDLLDKLYSLDAWADDDGQPEPATVGISSAGKAAWIEFYNEHAERLADASGDEAAVLSKIEGAAARLSLVVHCVREAAGDSTVTNAVDEQSIGTGVALARWYADETARVYSVLRETDEDRRLRRIVELIERKGGSITARQLRQSMREFRDSTEAAEAALDTLAKAGSGTWETIGPADDGGRPTRIFKLSTLSTSTQPSQTLDKKQGSVDVDNVDKRKEDTGGMEFIVL